MEIADVCQSLQDDKLASGALNQVSDNNLFGVSEHCHYKVKQSNVKGEVSTSNNLPNVACSIVMNHLKFL